MIFILLLVDSCFRNQTGMHITWHMVHMIHCNKDVIPLHMQGHLSYSHDEHDGLSNHWHLNCLLNRLFRCRSKKTKFCVTGLCEGNPPVTGGFPSQKASDAENIYIWWRHHGNYADGAEPVAGMMLITNLNSCVNNFVMEVTRDCIFDRLSAHYELRQGPCCSISTYVAMRCKTNKKAIIHLHSMLSYPYL